MEPNECGMGLPQVAECGCRLCVPAPDGYVRVVAVAGEPCDCARTALWKPHRYVKLRRPLQARPVPLRLPRQASRPSRVMPAVVVGGVEAGAAARGRWRRRRDASAWADRPPGARWAAMGPAAAGGARGRGGGGPGGAPAGPGGLRRCGGGSGSGAIRWCQRHLQQHDQRVLAGLPADVLRQQQRRGFTLHDMRVTRIHIWKSESRFGARGTDGAFSRPRCREASGPEKAAPSLGYFPQGLRGRPAKTRPTDVRWSH